MDYAAIFERHKVAALQFSGGKDSLACLYLLRPYWERLAVCWVNTGDAFPETLAQMEAVRSMVPNFIEVKSDVRAQQERYGYPVDVLPLRNHVDVMHVLHPHPRVPLQSFVSCCGNNLWAPMLAQMKKMGATLIIRGQRNDEVQHTPVRSGDVLDGVEYLFPLEDWSSEDVRAYLCEKLPPQYAYMDTGLDCMHCTAHMFENLGKRSYMKEKHPSEFSEVTRRLGIIYNEVRSDMQHVEAALGV